MMMARPCFVALLCVALWCGVVFGQEKNDATDAKEDTTVDNDASPDQQPPKEMVDEAASSTTSSTTTTTEGSNAAPGEASPSDGTMEKEAEMEGVMGDDDDDEGDEDENEEDEGDEMEEDYVENEEVADAVFRFQGKTATGPAALVVQQRCQFMCIVKNRNKLLRMDLHFLSCLYIDSPFTLLFLSCVSCKKAFLCLLSFNMLRVSGSRRAPLWSHKT
ncbi:hypothetical protein E2C01_016272 [Portunus trituberculatus]|uniref:Mucin-associated surface protein (MASP) n=1 Tax=Portunus trituberculatus TaxID=210409 RepID=A0A5B7DNN4_PORTR|nr:hypothetical protein [Portunus trituberculatus]